MRSLWTTWGEPVYSAGYSLRAYTRRVVDNISAHLKPVGSTTAYARVVQVLYPAHSTALLSNLSLLNWSLSPLSTPPITTTTKYLN